MHKFVHRRFDGLPENPTLGVSGPWPPFWVFRSGGVSLGTAFELRKSAQMGQGGRSLRCPRFWGGAGLTFQPC